MTSTPDMLPSTRLSLAVPFLLGLGTLEAAHLFAVPLPCGPPTFCHLGTTFASPKKLATVLGARSKRLTGVLTLLSSLLALLVEFFGLLLQKSLPSGPPVDLYLPFFLLASLPKGSRPSQVDGSGRPLTPAPPSIC